MRKIIVFIFFVLTLLSSSAMSERATDWTKKADVLWDGEKFTDPKKALEYLNHAIKLQPNYATAYNNRGNAYADLGQYPSAIKDYNEAIRLKPDFSYAYINRGDAYYNLGQYMLAIEDCNQALRLKPDLALAYSNRGKAYAKLGRYQPAINDFNEAIRLRPDDVNALNNRSVTYLLQENKILGCRDAQKACALGLCKVLEWAKRNSLCPQESFGKSPGDKMISPKTDAAGNLIPQKQSPTSTDNVRPSVAPKKLYKEKEAN